MNRDDRYAKPVAPDDLQLLAQLGALREISTRPGTTVATEWGKRMYDLTKAIDGLVEVITGDREYFWTKPPKRMF